MAYTNVITHFQKLLLQFITEPDPLLAMLQGWIEAHFRGRYTVRVACCAGICNGSESARPLQVEDYQ